MQTLNVRLEIYGLKNTHNSLLFRSFINVKTNFIERERERDR